MYLHGTAWHVRAVEAGRIAAPAGVVSLVRGDLLKDTAFAPDSEAAQVVVYIASLLFEDDFMHSIGQALGPVSSIKYVLTLTPFPSPPPGLRLAYVQPAEMTWGVEQDVFVYARVSAGAAQAPAPAVPCQEEP